MLLTELIAQCEDLLKENGDGEVACWTYRWDRCGDIDTFFDPHFDISLHKDSSISYSPTSAKFVINA